MHCLGVEPLARDVDLEIRNLLACEVVIVTTTDG